MFKPVERKLERAAYCLENLKAMASKAKGLAHFAPEERQAMSANVDCFFFEVVSAKDFFLQGIRDASSVTSLERRKVSEETLINCLPDGPAKDVVTRISMLVSGRKLIEEQKLEDDDESWLWRLNNYRNSATHRELIHFPRAASVAFETQDRLLLGEVSRLSAEGKLQIIPLSEIPQVTPPGVTRVDNVKVTMHLYRDPEDPDKGHTDLEVIPYCEQSLQRMTDFLGKLYAQLGI